MPPEGLDLCVFERSLPPLLVIPYSEHYIAWRDPKEQRPGAVQRGHIRAIEAVVDTPDAEPVMPCDAAKTAIIVYGKRVGTKLTVCTDKHCPVHDPQAAAEAAAHPAPVFIPAPEAETEEEAAQREVEHEQRMAEYKAEQERKEEERKAEFDRQQKEYEAEQACRDKQRKAWTAPSSASSNRLPAHSAPHRCASSFACSSTLD